MTRFMSEVSRYTAAVNHVNLVDSITLRADMSHHFHMSITC